MVGGFIICLATLKSFFKDNQSLKLAPDFYQAVKKYWNATFGRVDILSQTQRKTSSVSESKAEKAWQGTRGICFSLKISGLNAKI